MSRLFTYTIPFDDGAAPNPFHGICTLAICKPRIRRVAEVGDWVAGLGSKNARSGDLSGKLIYAMKVEGVISLAEYDERAAREWPNKIPNPLSMDLADRLGDCIYDYSRDTPQQRMGVHGQQNIDVDLGGENVLLSQDFYYFGSSAIPLHRDLMPICHQTRGHRSTSNADYFAPFEYWIRGLGRPKGQLHGWPDMIVNWAAAYNGCGCNERALDEPDEPVC